MTTIILNKPSFRPYLTNTSLEKHKEHETALKDKIKLTYDDALEHLCRISHKKKLKGYFRGYNEYQNEKLQNSKHTLISAMVDKEEAIIYLIIKNNSECMSLKSYNPSTDKINTLAKRLKPCWDGHGIYAEFGTENKYYDIAICGKLNSQTIKEIWQKSPISFAIHHYDEELETANGKSRLINPLDINGLPVESICSENFFPPRLHKEFTSIMKRNTLYPTVKFKHSFLLCHKENASTSVILPDDYEAKVSEMLELNHKKASLS